MPDSHTVINKSHTHTTAVKIERKNSDQWNGGGRDYQENSWQGKSMNLKVTNELAAGIRNKVFIRQPLLWFHAIKPHGLSRHLRGEAIDRRLAGVGNVPVQLKLIKFGNSGMLVAEVGPIYCCFSLVCGTLFRQVLRSWRKMPLKGVGSEKRKQVGERRELLHTGSWME